MNKSNFIELLRAKIEEQNKILKDLEENDNNNFIDRGITIGRINGLLLAWEIASNMEG